MMSRFIASTALALLLFFGAAGVRAENAVTAVAATAAAHRDGAQPFLSGNGGDMAAVGTMVAESLRHDPTGNSPISVRLCALRRACITPRELYDQIKSQHPNVGLGNAVSDLATYLPTLVKNEHPAAGRRTVGRVLIRNGVRAMDYGYGREPAPGEVIWTDVNTGEEVLMGNCLNTISLDTVSEVVVTAWDCARIVVEVRPGDPGLNFAMMGDYAPDACFSVAYLGPHMVRGENDPPITRVPLPTHCPDRVCSFAGFERATGLALTQSGGMRVQPGFYEFGVSHAFAENPRNLAVFCLDHGQGRHSCGIDVRRTDYHDHHMATVFYDRGIIPATWTYRRLYWAMPDTRGNCPDD